MTSRRPKAHTPRAEVGGLAQGRVSAAASQSADFLEGRWLGATALC